MIGGETEVLGGNVPQCHILFTIDPIRLDPRFEPKPPRWEAGDYSPELWHRLGGGVYVKGIIVSEL
jgi:hypothetical protein